MSCCSGNRHNSVRSAGASKPLKIKMAPKPIAIQSKLKISSTAVIPTQRPTVRKARKG